MAKKKKIIFILLICLLLPSCGSSAIIKSVEDNYRNYYEIFVGSFYDSDGDGMGDIKGMTQKLDYLNDNKADSTTSLQIDGIWLMPIMPSPSYHKYDVTDYYAIDPAYGTMEDFEEFIKECEKRGIKVIIDLVINHSSSEHSWFIEATNEIAEGKELRYANYYNITDEKVNSTYHSLGSTGHYYEGIFYYGMPDLNFDSDELREEFKDIAKFWLDKGVGGFRLDAIKHMYTSVDKSVDFIQWFTEYCVSVDPNVYIVGEVWSPDSEIMDFYESGITSLFNFGFAEDEGTIAKAVNNNVGADFASQVVRWDKLMKSRNENAIDAPFISNHDNNRSAGYFSSDLTKMKMAASLYLFMPGNPFIYYGEEIGMEGKGIDENKRGPMIWSLENSTGQTRGPLAMTEKTVVSQGVNDQLKDENSLTRFYIDAIRTRNKYHAISRGTPTVIRTDNRAIAAYALTYGDKSVVIVHNLSGETATVTLSDGVISKVSSYLFSGDDKTKPTFNNSVLELSGFSTVILD